MLNSPCMIRWPSAVIVGSPRCGSPWLRMHFAHVTISVRIFASWGVVGAGGWGRYWLHFAIAERNAGALTDTPLIEIVLPFDCWAKDFTP
jgi:hypothetical protein